MPESAQNNSENSFEIIDRQTAATQARYNRIAPVYDLVEWFTELSAFQEWRRELWSRLPAGRILELGVGTGKNMPYYPQDAQVTAIDLSERMLARSRQLRGAGAAEASLGVAVLSKAPLDVPTLYRLVAPGYAAIDPGWRAWFYPQAPLAFDRALSSSLHESGDILDLGCGVGANLARIKAMQLPFGYYIGVDLTDAMLLRAQERYGGLPNVRFQQLDLMRDALPEGPYDLIVSTWVFEHLPNPALVAEKAWERLKPGGRMVLLFESQSDSFLSRVIGWIYPFFSAHLVDENEYRRFPGQAIVEDHFSGPLGDLTFLVLDKPETIPAQNRV